MNVARYRMSSFLSLRDVTTALFDRYQINSAVSLGGDVELLGYLEVWIEGGVEDTGSVFFPESRNYLTIDHYYCFGAGSTSSRFCAEKSGYDR